MAKRTLLEADFRTGTGEITSGCTIIQDLVA
jgi:hypothetical protein